MMHRAPHRGPVTGRDLPVPVPTVVRRPSHAEAHDMVLGSPPALDQPAPAGAADRILEPPRPGGR